MLLEKSLYKSMEETENEEKKHDVCFCGNGNDSNT